MLYTSLKAGSGLGSDGHQTRPADILLTTWGIKGSTSLLNSSILSESEFIAGVAASRATEVRKHG